MPYVNERWLGGTLTNFKVIMEKVKKMDRLAKEKEEGYWSRYTKKERLNLGRELAKLKVAVAGLKELTKLPEAIGEMKSGEKVRRTGWNGKGMWITIGKGAVIEADSFWNEHTKQHALDSGGSAKVYDYITMKTATGSICMGWLASQSDMLAEDWEIA